MSEQFINLTIENIDKEHLCCAIADKQGHKAATITRGYFFRPVATGRKSALRLRQIFCR